MGEELLKVHMRMCTQISEKVSIDQESRFCEHILHHSGGHSLLQVAINKELFRQIPLNPYFSWLMTKYKLKHLGEFCGSVTSLVTVQFFRSVSGLHLFTDPGWCQYI